MTDGPEPYGSPARARLAFVAWVVVVTLVLVPLVFHAGAKVGPGRFSFEFRPSLSGRTELVVAPLGSLSARTHRAPVNVRIGLEEVNVVDAIGSTRDGGADALEAQIREGLPNAAVRVGLTLLGVSLLVGAGAALAFPGRRSFRRIAAGATCSAMIIALWTVPVALTYDPEPLRTSPEIRGPIAASDTLVAKVTGLDTRFGTVEDRAETLSRRIAELYSSARTEEISRSAGDVVLLHVSDLHLNGVGLSLAKDLAQRFKVDAVVDTGDITSFGFAPEAGFTDQLKGFRVPYYLVAGNHDSSEVRAELRRSPYLRYVDGTSFNIKDVKVLGIADPTNTALRKIPTDEIRRTYENQYAKTRRLVRRTKPDLLLAHNPIQIDPVLGEVPAAAVGHLHVTKLEIVKGTVVSVVGSSGATGLGNLLVDRSQPYRFELLRFTDGRLVAVDEIEIDGDGGDFTLRRRMITPDQPDTTDALPEALDEEPSREQVEREDPAILDAVTSSTNPDISYGSTTTEDRLARIPGSGTTDGVTTLSDGTHQTSSTPEPGD